MLPRPARSSRSSSTPAPRACTCEAGRAGRHPWSDREDFRRGPRPHEGPDGEERRDRARRREGWLRRQTAAGSRRPRGAPGRGHRLLQDPYPRHARPDGQPGGRPRRRRGRGALRRGRPLPRRGGGQGHGDLLGYIANGISGTTGSGSATPSPRAARAATTTRRWGSRRRARGSR